MKLCILILAGGLGTRLRSVVEDVPKSLAPVKGIPFLVYLLDWLNTQNVCSEVVLSVGYKADLIMQRIGSSYKDLNIHYAIEDAPLGTGGAIKNSLQQFQDYDNYIILNGDTYATIDLNEFVRFHESNHSDVSIASCSMYDFDRYGALTIDVNNTVIRFNEKAFVKNGFINCGVYLFTSDFCKRFILENKFEKFSLEKDVLEDKMKLFLIKAFISDFYFKDIGIPEDYQAAQNEFPTLTNG